MQLLFTMLTVELESQHFLSIFASTGEQSSGIGGRCSKVYYISPNFYVQHCIKQLKKKDVYMLGLSPDSVIHFHILSLHLQSHSQILMY